MKMKLALASLLAFLFCESVLPQVIIDTSGSGGAVTTTSSPINQAIGGSNNAQGGLGGSGGTSTAITGSSAKSQTPAYWLGFFFAVFTSCYLIY